MKAAELLAVLDSDGNVFLDVPGARFAEQYLKLDKVQLLRELRSMAATAETGLDLHHDTGDCKLLQARRRRKA